MGSTESPQPLLLGSHVERADVIAGARARNADVVQVNLSAPQTWRSPVERGDEPGLRDSGLLIYVHAPYLVNPSSINPEVRRRARQCLIEQSAAAARVGAKGLVVHGGHPTGSGTVEDGIEGWLEVLDGWTPQTRLLIENTAGGSAAVARHVEPLGRLFTTLRAAGHDVGFCLDTCHAWAGGMPYDDLVARVVDVVGRVDLTHVNNSKDPYNSSRDRHEHLRDGQIDPEWVLGVVRDAAAPAVVETPGGALEQGADVAFLRSRLLG